MLTQPQMHEQLSLIFDFQKNWLIGVVGKGGQIVNEDKVMVDSQHADELLPFLQAIVKKAGLSFADIDYFACVTGPSSFSRARASVAAVHGLVLGTGAHSIGFTRFFALAHQRKIPQGLLVATEEVTERDYAWQLFSMPEKQALTRAELVKSGQLPDNLPQGKLICAGNAAVILAKKIGVRASAPSALHQPSAKALLHACLSKIQADPEPLRPLYLKPPDATPAKAKLQLID